MCSSHLAFFSMLFIQVQVVHPYRSTDTAIAQKESLFILRSDFYMIDNLSSAVHNLSSDIAFSRWDITDKVCELVYWFQRFATKYGNGSSLIKSHECSFISLKVEANAFCCLLQVMQQGFCFCRCICKKLKSINIVCISHSFNRISFFSFCSLMVWETEILSQVKSYQRLKKWYLMLLCLTLSIIRYGSRVKWSNPGKGVAPFPTPWSSSSWKRDPLGYPRLRLMLIVYNLGR